jgi:hypothetical protein
MKKILGLIKGNVEFVAMFAIWVIVTVQNMNIYWMLVDDGVSVVFSKTLFEKFMNLNLVGIASQLFEDGSRFRPFYWIYNMAVWLIGGSSFQIHHLVHMLIVGATMLFIYLIIRELTHSRTISSFGALTYLLTPLNTENIFRLGPQEPLMVLLISISFYLLIKSKKVFVSCLLLTLAVFTKETSMALLPVLLFYYFYGKKVKLIKNNKQGFYLWIVISISAIIVILATFLRRNGYSTNYYFDLPMLIGNLTVYIKDLSKNFIYLFPSFFIIYCLRTLIVFIKTKKFLLTKLDLFEFTFLFGFVCFLLIQLPWKYAMTRYLMPTSFFLIVFSSIEAFQIFEMLKVQILFRKYVKIASSISVVLYVYICLIWFSQLIFKEMSSVSFYEAFKKMSTLPENSDILMNMPEGEGTVELVYETNLHLSEFWGRKDLSADYLNIQNLPKKNYVIVDSDQLPRNYSKDKLNLVFGAPTTTMISTSKGLVITTPLEMIKQIVKKTFNYLLYKEKITSDGLYTYYYYYNNWYFYNE